MALAPGTRLGAYEIQSLLGAGGMGQVYRGRDAALGRDVALKVLPASVAADPERLARFRREAQLLASLNHPNIAQVYGFDESSDQHALVMELVPGDTLDAIINRGPVPLPEALGMARQIALALEAAHEQGIVHRDLKPANIKIRDDGTVKVLDFGLAKAMDTSSGITRISDPSNSPTLTAHATQLGVILGTAAYMAPEQAKGKSVDRRADIWAFGVVLYEILTGRRGYHAEDVTETLAAVLTREVDWSLIPADTPARLRSLLRDCLVRDPQQRLRDIGDARLVLDKILSGAPGEAGDGVGRTAAVQTRPPAWRRALPWTIAGAALVAAAFAIWQAQAAPPAAPTTVTRSRLHLEQLAGFVNVARDGSKLVYTSIGGPKTYVTFVRMMDEFEGRAIPGSDGSLLPMLSPDGQWVAFMTVDAPTQIRKMPITGGSSITLCGGDFSAGSAWGPDETIVFSNGGALMRVAATGGTAEALTQLDKTKGETAHIRPQFLPGGRELLFTVIASGNTEPAQFAILDLATRKYRLVARGGDNGRYAPSGHLTYVRGGTLFAAPFDLTSGKLVGSETPVVENVSTTGPTGTGDYSFSDDGLLMYSESAPQQGSTLAFADRKGAITQLPGQVTRDWGTGRLSPDGTRVANGIHDAKGTDVWVVDLSRGAPERLTFGGANDNPIWTADGRRVIYGGTRDGKSGIFVVPADGSKQPELLLATDGAAVPTSLTSDGKTLYLTRAGQDGRLAIAVLSPVEGAKASDIRPFRESGASGNDSNAQVSSDGQLVAFESTESGTREIYVQSAQGTGKTRISTMGGRGPRWGRNNRELLYWGNTPGNPGLMLVPLELTPSFRPGTPQELFRLGAGTTWDIAPGGEKFLVEVSRISTGATFAVVTNWFDELRRRAPMAKK